MDVELAGEYTIFLDDDDCALLQLGSLSMEAPQPPVTLRIGDCDNCISLQESAEGIAITISPAAYGALLHMSFAVGEANGRRIWLRLNESKFAQQVAAEA